MFLNQVKTVLLLTVLSSFLLLFGFWLGGSDGVVVALIFSLVMNFVTYFFSDKLVLSMYGAQELDRERFADIYTMVEELSHNASLPMPKLWYIETEMANAFATGRNPAHASVAVTQGILNILDANELRGVLAHELSHVKNRDILISTVAATIASAIGYLAHMLQWAAIFGGTRDRDDNKGGSAISALAIAILMPIIATLVQLAISRSREYLADETGAKISRDPLALASALERLSSNAHVHQSAPRSTAEAATASLFIVNPFTGGGLLSLLSTHPPMEERIARLREMAKTGRF